MIGYCFKKIDFGICYDYILRAQIAHMKFVADMHFVNRFA